MCFPDEGSGIMSPEQISHAYLLFTCDIEGLSAFRRYPLAIDMALLPKKRLIFELKSVVSDFSRYTLRVKTGLNGGHMTKAGDGIGQILTCIVHAIVVTESHVSLAREVQHVRMSAHSTAGMIGRGVCDRVPTAACPCAIVIGGGTES